MRVRPSAHRPLCARCEPHGTSANEPTADADNSRTFDVLDAKIEKIHRASDMHDISLARDDGRERVIMRQIRHVEDQDMMIRRQLRAARLAVGPELQRTGHDVLANDDVCCRRAVRPRYYYCLFSD